jgi:hypothetical protein
MGLNSHEHGVTMGSSILKKEGDGRLLIEEFHFVSCMCVCVCVFGGFLVDLLLWFGI